MEAKRLLLIWEDRAAAARLAEDLADAGLAVEFADDAAAALALLADKHFDLILLEAALPGDAAVELVRLYPRAPCVVFGPSLTEEGLCAVFRSGAIDFLERRPGWESALPEYLNRMLRIRQNLLLENVLSAKRYEDLVEALPDIVYELDTDGHFTFVNQSIRVLGYAPGELIGKHFSVILFEEDVPHVSRDQVLPLYNNNRTGQRHAPKLFDERRGIDRKTENLELRLKRKDGQTRAGSDLIASVISYGEIASAGAYRSLGEEEEKTFVGTVGIIRDISLRRKSEDTLRKMYQAVDQSPAAVIIVDSDLAIEYVNPAFFALTGIGPDQTIGRDLADFLGNAGDQALYADLVASARSGIDWNGELRCVRFGADPFWAAATVSAIRSPAGTITHFLCQLEDVSRKRMLDKLMLQAKEAAEQASRAKSEFLANISGELRDPLVAVIAGMGDLRESASAPAIAKLDELLAKAGKLRGLIDDLLDLSKIETRAIELKPVEFDLKPWVDALAAPFAAQAAEKGLAFRYRVEDGGFPRINTDQARLSQIVVNLCSNAIKFTSEGSVDLRFAVRAKDEVPALFISVRDTGIGISGIDQQKLFKHFSQVDTTISHQYGGTGLGLAIAKELALRLGGDIWVESTPGLGSTFAFYIPIAAAGLASPETAKPILAGHPLNLLVVEDNQVNREYLQMILQNAGHKVESVQDGYQALAALERGDFDAVLMDLQLPGMDGISTVTTIRSYTGAGYDPRIPVIAVTAFAEMERSDAFIHAEFSGCLAKPVNARTLLQIIDEAVHRKDRFDLERLRKQYVASADEFKRLLMVAANDLPKRLKEFEAKHRSGAYGEAESILRGSVSSLSAIGAVRALQLIKRYGKAIAAGGGGAAAVAEDLQAEIAGIRKQTKKALEDL
jgi:PAS domain S-box-containing protein